MPRAIHCTATSSDSCRAWFRVETPLMATPTALQPPVRGHHSRLVLLSWFHPRCATVGRQTPGNLAAWCYCHAGVGTRQLMVSFNLLVDCFVKLCWAHFVNIDVPDLSNCYQSQFGQLGYHISSTSWGATWHPSSPCAWERLLAFNMNLPKKNLQNHLSNPVFFGFCK